VIGKILFFVAAVAVVGYALVLPLVRSVRKTAARPGLAVAGVVGVGVALAGVAGMPLIPDDRLDILVPVTSVVAVAGALMVAAASIRSGD